MGNCASSASNYMQVELGIAPPRIRVVHAAEARVVDVAVPASQATMSVGELMLEFTPGHFVAQLDLSDPPRIAAPCIGKRASPLGADAEATPGSVYVLFPMPRLHTRIAPQELLSLAKLLHLHDARQLPKAAYNPCKLPRHPPNPRLQVHLHRLFIGRASRVAPLAHEYHEDDNLSSSALSHNDQVIIKCPLMASCPTPIDSDRLLQQQDEQHTSTSTTSCHGPMQMQVIKSKPWTPKLETIKEGSSS